MLSDVTRRREYDDLYSTRASKDRTTDPGSSTSFFTQFANMFAGSGTGASTQGQAGPGGQPNAEGMFADVFEEVRSPFPRFNSLLFI